MRAALPNDKFLNLRAAHETRFSFTIIHPKIILEFSAAIRPVYGCAITADAFPQNLLDRFMQRSSLFLLH